MKSSRVLINSLPKSGTHLLSRVVELFGYREHFDAAEPVSEPRATPLFFNYREVKNTLVERGWQIDNQSGNTICVGTLTPVEVDLPVFREWLEAMPQQRYILGHLGWTPALAPVLSDLKYFHLFIIRDPRAVIASLIAFILDSHGMPKRHFLEADFRLMSPAERLEILLHGGFAPQANVRVRGFADIYRSMFAWRNDPSCFMVRFEDLVGEQGGGSAERQKTEVKRMAVFLGEAFDSSVTDKLDTIYNRSARTYRKGSVDSWKQALDAESVELLIEYCRLLCEETGYGG